MKKKILSLVAITLVSFTLVSCSVKIGVKDKGDSSVFSSSKGGEKISEEYELSDVNSIDIEIDAAIVKVKTYDGNKIKVEGYLGKSSKGIKSEKNNKEIEIIEECSKSFVNNDVSDYEILIPSSFNGDLSFTIGAGTGKLNDVKVNKLELESGAGELNINNVVFNKLDLSCGVGTVNMNLNEKCGDMDIEGGVGETVINIKEVGGNLTCEGGVGSTKITMPENAPVKFNTESGLGSCNITAKTSGENTYTFDLEVGVGEIKVTN